MASSTQDDEPLISGINVTPLVDVVLVLLVVLMVTASYVTRHALPIDPPAVHTAATSPPVALEVVVDTAGRAYVDGAPADPASLRALATAYAARVGAADARAMLSADRMATHGDVVAALDALHDAHITHVAIRVRQSAPAP